MNRIIPWSAVLGWPWWRKWVESWAVGFIFLTSGYGFNVTICLTSLLLYFLCQNGVHVTLNCKPNEPFLSIYCLYQVFCHRNEKRSWYNGLYTSSLERAPVNSDTSASPLAPDNQYSTISYDDMNSFIFLMNEISLWIPVTGLFHLT